MLADSSRRKLSPARWPYPLLVLLTAILIIAGAFAWWQRPERNGVIVRSRALAALPEGQLFYPGALMLAQGGYDYEWGLWGSNPAITDTVLGTNANPEEIIRFYDRELLARG